MNPRSKHLVILLLILMNCSCKSQNDSADAEMQITEQNWFHADSLLHHVKILSSDAFEGRKTGTVGAKKARNYIVAQYNRFDILPLNDNFEQPFSFNLADTNYNAVNVLGYVQGSEHPDKYIVISAHYDHLGIENGKIYNGADDDASGISALFAFAQYFKRNPPKHSVILAAFDSEELDLKGSNYFVNHSIVPFDNIRLNINMDMISRSDSQELFVVGTRYNNQFEPVIKNHNNEGLKLLIGHDGSDGRDDWTFTSDHGPFHLKGIPFLYFGVEDHKDYHRATDDFENIHPKFYVNVVTTIIQLFATIDTMKL